MFTASVKSCQWAKSISSATNRVLSPTCFRPESVDGEVAAPELFGHAEDAHTHAVLGHRVGHVVAEPPEIDQMRV